VQGMTNTPKVMPAIIGWETGKPVLNADDPDLFCKEENQIHFKP